MAFSKKLRGLLVLAAAAFATTQAHAEGALEPEYTSDTISNTHTGCAKFQSQNNPFHKSEFCRGTTFRPENLEIVGEQICWVTAFQIRLVTPIALSGVRFWIKIGNKTQEIFQRGTHSGYGGPVKFIARVECPDEGPLPVHYTFEHPQVYGFQDNHGEGFQLELPEFDPEDLF